MTHVVESMNTNTGTIPNTCGMQASHQLTNDCTSLIVADRSLRPDCVDVDLQGGSESECFLNYIYPEVTRGPMFVFTGLCGSILASSNIYDRMSLFEMGTWFSARKSMLPFTLVLQSKTETGISN
jgi:hypothetical protein